MPSGSLQPGSEYGDMLYAEFTAVTDWDFSEVSFHELFDVSAAYGNTILVQCLPCSSAGWWCSTGTYAACASRFDGRVTSGGCSVCS